MEDRCINCGNLFEKRKKGFKRKSIDSSTKTCVSFRNILESTLNVPITPEKNLFMCGACASVCQKIQNCKTGTVSAVNELQSKKSQSSYLGKRKRKSSAQTSTPNSKGATFKSPVFCSPLKKKCNNSTRSSVSSSKSLSRKKSSFVEKAVSNLRESKYFTCFKNLIVKSKAAKEGFVKCVKFAVDQEMKALKRADLFLMSKVSQDSLENFAWLKTLGQIETKAPVLSSAVKGSLTTNRTQSKLSLDDTKEIGHLVPAFGFMLSTIMYLRIPQCSFLQEVVSIEMYRSGCSQKLFTWFNKLGLCRSVSATRILIDRLCLDFDKQINIWKTNIQAIIKPTHTHGCYFIRDKKNSQSYNLDFIHA